MARATRLLSGWGLKYFDYDNDGVVDLILANGHPDDMIDGYSMQVKYKEPLLLFHQGNDRKLHNVSRTGGSGISEVSSRPRPGRGRLRQRWRAGCVDRQSTAVPPVLLKNNAAKGNNWLGLKLEGVTCNRDAVGAQHLWTAGGKVSVSG